MAAIETFKAWAEGMRADVESLKGLVECASADVPARKLAAGALSYLVTKMDLVPDWNAGIGLLDDAMVLRVAAQLTQSHHCGELPTAVEVALARLANEAEQIGEFLGAPLFDKLRAHVAKLTDVEVRGRTPGVIVDDAAARERLWQELRDELANQGPVALGEPADSELRLRAYLTHKLA
ncbi:MAG: YkvA family protein [Kofleriaceae bacterium]